jgi:ligand-binding sensor domain-containing protein/signal transduction histidine kinase
MSIKQRNIFSIATAFILSLATTICLQAQNRDIKFEHLYEGLSQSSVRCILKDSKGYMWFGTYYGLNKYDAYGFKIYKYDQKDPRSLSGNRISCIYEDREGILWVGTYLEGLNAYDRELDSFVHYRNNPADSTSLSSDFVRTIFEDNNGNLWIGTLYGGLNLFERSSKTFKHLRQNSSVEKNSLQNNDIFSIIEDHDGKLWIGTNGGGLHFFDPQTKTFTFFRYTKDNPVNLNAHNFGKILKEDKNGGSIWIGTSGEGIWSFNKGTHTFKNYTRGKGKTGLNHQIITDLYQNESGNLWIATDGGGINILDPVKETYSYLQNDPDDKSSISNNQVYTIYRDDQDIVWIGNYNGAINIFNRSLSKFSLYTQSNRNKNSLSFKSVLSFCEDYQGKIWIGTDGGGLNLFDRERNLFRHFMHDDKNPKSIGGNAVTKVYEDKRRNLWIGTYAAGLILYDRKKNRFISHLNNPADDRTINSNNIFAIFEDSRNNLWIGTLDAGLNLFDRDKNIFRHYMHNEKDTSTISHNAAMLIYEDQQGNLWIGTEGGGLNKFNRDTGKFIRYVHNPDKPGTIPNNEVKSIFEDSQGNLWVGTVGSGLCLLDRATNTFKAITTENGLPSNAILAIIEDNQQNLWLSTNSGLCKFNPQKNTFRSYDISDGLQSNEFNYSAFLKSKKGELYFGGLNGFNVFNPDEISDNAHIPPVFITDFLIFNKPQNLVCAGSPLEKNITETCQLTLSYKQSVFSFEFAALNFTSANKNQYAYILEGFEDNWNYIGNRRTATYTNINPGEYIFRVKASNNDRIWNEAGTYIAIKITPPFWQTWWFRTLSLLAILGLTYSVYRIRVRSIKIQKENLEQQVKERTQELNERNSELNRSKKETDDILQNVKDGLFLLDEKYCIESQYSAALEKIFGESNLGRKSFLKYLENKIGPEIIDSTASYLDLLFTKKIDEHMLSELNPLGQIELHFENGKIDESISKYLTFDFRRIVEMGKTVRIIASVNDITEKIALAKDLEETKEASKRKMDLLLSILNVEPVMLEEFIKSSQDEIDRVDDVIQELEQKETAIELLESVYRSIHTIKGNASMLELDLMADRAHQVEDMISQLRKKDQIKFKDIKSLLSEIESIHSIHQEVKDLIEQISKIHEQFRPKRRHEHNMLINSLNKLITNLGDEYQKKVKLATQNFKSDLIPYEQRLILRDVLVQLVRNAIYHGLETSQERHAAGKKEIGTIKIVSIDKKDRIRIQFEDDGRGLQFDKLREKAKESGKWSDKEINGWNNQQLAELIYLPGITTVDNANMTAGRGFGMDIVKQKIKRLGGEIKIDTRKGKYCKFIIELPKKAA